MSLREDFRNYFCSTFVGVRIGNQILPYRIDDVTDNSDFGRGDFTDAHKAHLKFQGTLFVPATGRTEEKRFNVTDERLVLETPPIGYYRDQRGRVRWVRYRASRNRLKGIHGQKLIGLNCPVSHAVLFKLFNPEFEGLVNMHLYISPISGVIFYKGVAVGKMIDGRATLLTKWQHINGMLREYNVTVVDNIQFEVLRNNARVVSEPHPRFDGSQEVLGEPNRPFEEAPRAAPRRRAEPEPYETARGHTTRTTEPASTQARTSGEQAEIDRARGYRSNGHPVPMHNESFPSFAARMDEFFANNPR